MRLRLGEWSIAFGDMIHLRCKYDVAHFIRNDAMFANSLGEADIIHEVSIISKATSLPQGKHHWKKDFTFVKSFFLELPVGIEPTTGDYKSPVLPLN